MRRSSMARSFIEVLLKEQGPTRWVDVVREGATFDHAEATLREVRNEIAVKHFHDGHWFWHLKEDSNG